MKPFSWKCPYCYQNVTISSAKFYEFSGEFDMGNKYGAQKASFTVIVCPNSKCREYTITGNLYDREFHQHLGRWSDKIPPKMHWRLLPKSFSKVFPDYIPKRIREDYEEACLICNLSSKASAALSRRCLQGMIRDFWKITKERLIDEINALEEKVDPLTWKAIDAVRSDGNIGAHMEKDINLIIDVDPGEASKLIKLIETLIGDWYIAREDWHIPRHEREKRLVDIVEIAQKKKKAKSDVKKTEADQKE